MRKWQRHIKNRIRTEQEKTQKRQPDRIFMDGCFAPRVRIKVEINVLVVPSNIKGNILYQKKVFGLQTYRIYAIIKQNSR